MVRHSTICLTDDCTVYLSLRDLQSLSFLMHKVIMEIVFIYRPFLQDITMLFSLKSLSARRIPRLAHLRKEGRKEGLVRSGMVRSCGLLSCLVLASNSGVTCENSIIGESYLNSSWDNKRPGVVSDVPQKVIPFLKCQCCALRPGPCKVPCRFIIGFGLYD